jgi:TPR repeat protein
MSTTTNNQPYDPKGGKGRKREEKGGKGRKREEKGGKGRAPTASARADGLFQYRGYRGISISPIDLKEAFRLFREGAWLGDADCCFRLGLCFCDARGTNVNVKNAFKWFQKAAEKGHASAMVYYGQFYL